MTTKKKKTYPVEVENEAKAINSEVANLNRKIKEAKEIMQKYTGEQIALREIVRNDNNGLNFYQLRKVQRDIHTHRIILCGFRAYMKDLKIRKEKLQKSHPKNMKKAPKSE